MKQCPRCNFTNIIAMEYGYLHPFHYDGISEYKCLECNYRQGRWTKKQLTKDEYEKPFGKA